MHDRNAIIATVDLRELADELLGAHAGGERNPTWRCPNPHHAQTGRTPPVNVFTSRRGEQRWRCHGCGEGGTAIDLVMVCRGTGLREAIEELAGRAGQITRAPEWELASRTLRDRDPSRVSPDPEGLATYVDSCSRVLWRPEGAAIRRWLTEERGLPDEVLRANHVGADLGPRRQTRPKGMCRTGGAVLPVLEGRKVVYAQVRVPHPQPDRPRYLNPASELAPNPRLARFRPPSIDHPEVIVTEGAIDALSAASAGYRAVAVLSAGYPDRGVAHALSRLPHPLVLVLDSDDAGRDGADRLASLLDAELRPATRLELGHGDLNDALRCAPDWQRELPDRVQQATARAQVHEPQRLSL